jgi:ketosteroid isomerase-like protein
MVAVSEVFKAWKEGLANKDSSKIGELFADDFVFTTTVTTRSKQETLAWVDAGGNPTVIDNLEVLYENDEVGVIHHSANNNNNDGVAIAVYTKKGGKISQVRVVRTNT